jgi:cell division transport system permease protein
VIALRRSVYFLRRAIDAMTRGPRVTLVSTLTIYVAVLVTGVFAATLHGAQKLLAAWGGEVQISAYLDPSADLAAARVAAQAVARGRVVEAVSSEEALRRFRRSLGAQGNLLEGVAPDVLPPSLEVRAPGLRVEEVRALAARLQGVPGVQEVDYGGAWLEPLERFVRRLRWVGVFLFVALASGAAVLVSNTLRLGVFARRDEIEIMRLVGATDGFVEAPFLIEGLLQGLLGGLLASLTLVVAGTVGLPHVAAAIGGTLAITRADVLPATRLLALTGAGAALGLFASALAVARELGKRG